ncbi:MAG: hypothetical protein Hens3KO_28420 [Henriciella sp.]
MSFKAAFLGGLAVTALGIFAHAQIDSESMGDLNAWGERYLTSEEKEFPTSLWSGSNDQTLLQLMQDTSAARLTPAERALLRRIILSPTRSPRGELADALLTERARLMLELGEADAAAALAPRLEEAARGLDAETIAVDLEMASGREASACNRLTGPVPEGAYWLKLRAVCAVLQENYSGAELAVEVATAQGLDDPWFVEAIFAASGDAPNPPGARFDTGLNIALSSRAALDLNRVTLSASRPDLAAAAAQRPGVPDQLRARFAEIADAAGLISAPVRRDIISASFTDPEFRPSNSLEETLLRLTDPLTQDIEKAEKLNSELLKAAQSDFQTYSSAAKLFLPDLSDLPKTYETGEYGIAFARAALAANDTELADAWLRAAEEEPPAPPVETIPTIEIDPVTGLIVEASLETAPEDVDTAPEEVDTSPPEIETRPAPDPFDIAVIQSLSLMLGADNVYGSPRAVQARLVESVQSDQQSQYAAHLLTLWSGFGITVGADGRALLRLQAEAAERVDPYQLITIEAAAKSGAIGEAALMALRQIDGSPHALASADLAQLISSLRQIQAEDIAARLAFEASEVWKQDIGQIAPED